MTPWKLALSSLVHYRWLNLAALLGVLLTSAILSGALVVGDSVKESLRRNAVARISMVDYALVGSDRFFTADLADKIGKEIEGTVAPVIQTLSTVSSPGAGTRVNQVQVVGVTDAFWKLATGEPKAFQDEDIAVNEALARRLDIDEGGRVLARVEIPGALSKDAPLSGATNEPQTISGSVTRVLGREEFGRYNLNAEQVPVPSLFLPLSRLQEILEQKDRANVILIGNTTASYQEFADVVEDSWSLADASLDLKKLEDSSVAGWQLSTPRVFMDAAFSNAVLQAYEGGIPVITYLVNAIHSKGNRTPYSMIAGTDLPKPQSVTGNEIAITGWLADDVGAAPGDEMSFDFFVMSTGRKLTEETANFQVKRVLPMDSPLVSRDWTPDFPGIADAEDNADWNPGMPFNKEWIRNKDEDYWDEYKTTPKAFISYDAGRELWANRFGEMTSLLFSADAFADAPAFEAKLKETVSFIDFGLIARDLAGEASDAVANSYDFGSLFAGMSFFLIIAALTLTALVFVFGIEQRRNQIGLLLALGVTKGKVRQVLLMEVTILALVGATLGLLAGMAYTKLALWGLGGAWQDAAVGVQFVYNATPTSLIASWVSTVVLSLIVVAWSTRAIAKIQPSQLIAGVDPMGSAVRKKPFFTQISLWVAIVCLLGGIAILKMPVEGAVMAKQGAFFGGGFLIVVAGIALGMLILNRIAQRDFGLTSVPALGRTNAVRQKWRSLSVMGLMAAGVFMVTAINSLRLSGQKDAGERDSGTGGFAYIGETTLPIYEDLNTNAGREVFGIRAKAGAPDDFSIVQFRSSQGDDASCLNLNRAQAPRLLGVDPEELAKRDAFFFQGQLKETEGSAWSLLNDALSERPLTTPSGSVVMEPVIPGVIDQATAEYALKLKLGQLISYQAPSGKRFHVQLVGTIDNSVLQGNIVISEKDFIRFFPDNGGYRYFLMDEADAESGERQSKELTRFLADQGLELQPAWQRLNEFNAVQNTYLSIFSTLGGLGLLLGTLGLAIVVSRNILERRGQMGLLEAVGFTKPLLSKLVVSEHWFLHVFGVVLGVVAGAISVAPTLSQRATDLPVNLLLVLNGLILVGGLLFCWLAARSMLRTQLIESLRHE